MNDGMIRCVALLRAMGSDPIVPYVAPRPRQEAREHRGGVVPLLVLIASLVAAFACASAWA